MQESGYVTRGRMKHIAIMLFALGVVAISVCAYVYRSLPVARVTVRNSGFADEKFLMLLFPVAGNVSCKRAVLASLPEYRRESLEVHVDGVAVTIPRSGFTGIPPQGCDTYVDRLNRELAAWGAETDWSNVAYTFSPSERGGTAILTIKDKRGTTCRYTYLVKGLDIQPVEVRTEVNLAKKMAR
jgi:hypothetical protein